MEVTFTAPDPDDHGHDDASGTFTRDLRVVKVTTDGSGMATAPTFTANGVPGFYHVKAAVAGVRAPARFSLANLLYPTTTTITASPTTSFVGQLVAFTATVASPAGPTPTGTVSFRMGSRILGTGTLDGSGQATFSTSALPAGRHNVIAKYGGDNETAKSTSTSVTELVGLRPTTTNLLSSPNPSSRGQAITFTVAVNSLLGGPPTGHAVLRDGNKKLAAAALNASGQAVFSISTLTRGKHNVSAHYENDGVYESSSSAPLTQTVN